MQILQPYLDVPNQKLRGWSETLGFKGPPGDSGAVWCEDHWSIRF